jgi:S-adenosylmethionine:tRNA ribosyltransferase-isomerase
VRVSLFDYELPDELIAQKPAKKREDARLLVVSDRPRHHKISELPSLLPPDSLVVLNDTRVFPARLIGKKASGGRV